MIEKKIETLALVHLIVSLLYIASSVVLMRFSNYDPTVLHTLLDVGISLFLFMTIINFLNFVLYINNRKNKNTIDKFSSIFNAFKEGILLFDNNLKISFISNRLESILGRTKAEIASEEIYDIEGVSYTNYILSRIKNREDIKEKFDCVVVNKSTNKNVSLHCEIHSITNADNRWYVVIVEDTTNIVHEHELLAKRIEETKELAEEKQQFLSRVSHEIRTPLNGIIGMNEIARENLINKDYKSLEDSLEKISFSSSYLLSIIENVLSMSRIESGKLLVEYKSFSFVNFLDEIKTVLGAQLAEKNMDFKIIKNFDELFVKTDETKLTQVLINIIGNSIKYTNPNGKIIVKVIATDKINDKVELAITIKDNGIGMSEKFAKHMFEPFSQENKIKGVPSTGLGLSITKSLVELLNGTISVESKENVGTTTTVTIVVDKVRGTNVNIVEVNDYDLLDYSKYRVLVAEDNKINQIVIKNHLDHYKFKTEIVDNGQLAVETFVKNEEGYFDFILMDIHMPILDGYEATRQIRLSDRKDNDIPIIALTADSLNEDVAKALVNQMNNHISKPVVREKMIKTIYHTLKTTNRLK